MDEIQLSALKYIVSYAYEHTLFYKKLYNNIDISSLSSIEELPIVTTEFLKKYPHEFKTDEPVYKVVMTSGTLSNPKILYRTQQDFEKSVDNECLLLNWAGIQKNDIVCIIQPFGINGYGELTLEACKKLGIFAVPLGDVQDDIVLAAIKTFSPTVLDISPSRLLTILSKIKPEENSIRLAMVAGEHITPNFKSNIFRKYGIQIINQYGSTELDGLAAEKLNEEGLHLIPNSFIFEIVDDQIVLTSLYHKGTPLIRYMLGDIATINNNIIEVCGRNASIQLIDGIILEQSIIDSIVAKYNGLFWQCILYNNKNTLCIEFRIFGDTSIDCELILKELTNSLDFEDLVSQKKVLLSCKSTSRIVGNTRKAIRYLDARNYSETISFELLKANCFEAYYYSLPRLTSSNIEKVISTYNLIDTNKLVDIGIFITHFWNERTWKLCPRIFHYCYNRNSKLLLKKCLEMAVNSDWEVREEAAKVIAIIVMNEFDRIDNWLNQCITSNNENIRRAILLSLKYCVEYDSDYSRREKLLSYMDLFLFDTSTYVKKSFDSFTIGDGFLNVCPELVEIKFDYWCTLNNERVACSVIRAFKSSGGVKSWPLAKKYLDYYRSANSSSIQKALTATSNYLKKRINLEDY